MRLSGWVTPGTTLIQYSTKILQSDKIHPYFSDFSPKVKDKPSSISANGFIRQKKDEKGTKSHVNIPGKTLEIPGGHVPDGYLSSSSGESADELIEEAESFLAAVREGKEALVSVEEWSVKRDRKVCAVQCG